jgi:hypothetical protein
MWVDGALYVVSGPNTQKSRNLAANPYCAVSVAFPGLDLVLEGTAERVTDARTVSEIVQRYAANGWPATAEGIVITAPYSAPSAGPPPWHLYAMTPSTAVGLATEEPHGATKWQFDS